MKRQAKRILWSIFARYAMGLVFGLFCLGALYTTLTWLTLHVLRILFIFVGETPIVYETMLRLSTLVVELIPACVAGAAYYLLLILTLATAQITLSTRLRIIATSFTALFLLNTLRILILIPLTGTEYFYEIHWLFWNLVSTIFVVGIWIWVTRRYRVRTIPVVSDFRSIMKLVNG